MKYIFGLLVIIIMLLCSCVTQRGAERYFDRNTEELAEYIDGNLDYTNEHGAAYAAKYFPVKIGPPEIKTRATVVPGRLITVPIVARPDGSMPASVDVQCDDVEHTHTTERIPYRDPAVEDTLHKHITKLNNGWTLTKQDLLDMTVDRDKWKDRAVKEFWALVGCGVFAVLFVVFKVLAWRASRIKPV